MLGQKLRPWGELSWMLSKSDNLELNVIGSVSFEDRCHGLISKLPSNQVTNHLFFNILPHESKVKSSQMKKLQSNLSVLQGRGVTKEQTINIRLLESVDTFLTPLQQFLEDSNGNIILDISCLPKRFFFPILKRLLQSDKLGNLIITYTKPSKYSSDELSWDPAEWSHIPTFMSTDFKESKPDLAIISVGFVPLGLTSLLTGTYSEAEVRLLFPHPPGPPNYQRNWEFVRRIVDSYPRLALNEMQRVHALSVSDAFDILCGITNNGKKKSILAPYGPKPVSLAMALFAIETGVPVYYTQPTYYAPDYSTGIKETYAYWIVNSGQKLYTL